MIDYVSTGRRVLNLRSERGLTQRELAHALHISPKTVSKWETGQGCPDIELLMELCKYFEVKVEDIIGEDAGVELTNKGVSFGKSLFYVCPFCGNVVVSSGKAEVRCCGRQLLPLEPEKFPGCGDGAVKDSADGQVGETEGNRADDDSLCDCTKAAEAERVWDMKVEPLDDEWYITTEHPMRKNHYVSFMALVTGDRIQMVKLYPEWDLQVRFPRYGHGKLMWYSLDNGFLYKLI